MSKAWIVMVLGLLVVGCGDDGDVSGDADSDALRGRDVERDSEQPPGTDPAAVVPYIQDLLVRFDQSVNQIQATPEIVRDPGEASMERLVDLFEPDSDALEELLGAWHDDADAGVSTRPFHEELPATTSSLDGEVATVSADEVQFPVCVEYRHRVYDNDDRLTARIPHRLHPAEGFAVRIDGEWRIRQVEVFEGLTGCRNEEQ